MNDVDFPYLQVIGFMLIVGLAIVLAVGVFTNDGSGRPTPAPARVNSPTGIATALYALGVLALLLGGLLFVFSDNSPHQILATLIGLGGAIFYAAGAVVTELQRIKKQLQADAARLQHEPQGQLLGQRGCRKLRCNHQGRGAPTLRIQHPRRGPRHRAPIHLLVQRPPPALDPWPAIPCQLRSSNPNPTHAA